MISLKEILKVFDISIDKIKKALLFMGLIFSILGTYFIWKDSQNSIKSLSILLENVANRVGFWQDNPIKPENIDAFEQTLNKASSLDKKGFYLLIIGFIFQSLTILNFKKIIKKLIKTPRYKLLKNNKYKKQQPLINRTINNRHTPSMSAH